MPTLWDLLSGHRQHSAAAVRRGNVAVRWPWAICPLARLAWRGDAHLWVSPTRLDAPSGDPRLVQGSDRILHGPVRRELHKPMAARLAGLWVTRKMGEQHDPVGIERLRELGVGEAVRKIGDEHVATDLVRSHGVSLSVLARVVMTRRHDGAAG